MAAHVPDILTTDDFSDPEMQMMVKDGLLKRLGNWYCPIYLPDTSGLRARGVFTDFGDAVIADTYTASWIYKCSTRVPTPLTGSLPRKERSASARRLGRIREVSIADDEIWRLDNLRITTPERTFRDMCRVVCQKGDAQYALREEIRGRLIAASIAIMFRIDLEKERDLLDDAGTGPFSRRAITMVTQVQKLIEQLSALDGNQQIEVLAAEQRKLPGFKLY